MKLAVGFRHLDKGGRLPPQARIQARPATSIKTVWAAIKKATGVTSRWHDNRRLFITGLAESGEASD
jgi:hypothetical protein